eukprot:8850525-Alexandrium_andersonii.AAC.1
MPTRPPPGLGQTIRTPAAAGDPVDEANFRQGKAFTLHNGPEQSGGSPLPDRGKGLEARRDDRRRRARWG